MEVTPKKAENVSLRFEAPPSKSYTHRALIAAALAESGSVILHPLDAGDTRVTAGALRDIGAGIAWDGDRCIVEGTAGDLSCPPGLTIDVRDSGTSMRLLTSVSLLCSSPVILTGSARMRERPIGPLAKSLIALGGEVEYLEKEGFPPLRVLGSLIGGRTRVDAAMSSQFVSSLLMAAPYARKDVILDIEPGIASPSYLDVTLDVMDSFGVQVERDGSRRFSIPAGQKYRGREHAIEGDYSSASYFFAMAALCKGSVRVKNLNPRSCQGDRRFLDALISMGCRVKCSRDCIEVSCGDDLEGIDIDMSSSPDTVQTLCMVAAKAKSPTRISGIGHLKYKESDRLGGTARLLRSLGGKARVAQDTLLITPSPLHGGVIDPCDDHRTAMSFAVLGLATGNVKITRAECVSKSFPGFWEQMAGQGLV